MATIDERRNLDAEKQSLLNQHKEKHFTAGEIVHDIIIGVSDGLTVPFALAAGLSSAKATSTIVLTAGITEVAAGAISMGRGGYIYFLWFYLFGNWEDAAKAKRNFGVMFFNFDALLPNQARKRAHNTEFTRETK